MTGLPPGDCGGLLLWTDLGLPTGDILTSGDLGGLWSGDAGPLFGDWGSTSSRSTSPPSLT